MATEEPSTYDKIITTVNHIQQNIDIFYDNEQENIFHIITTSENQRREIEQHGQLNKIISCYCEKNNKHHKHQILYSKSSQEELYKILKKEKGCCFRINCVEQIVCLIASLTSRYTTPYKHNHYRCLPIENDEDITTTLKIIYELLIENDYY